jgi:ParB family chromosome partitioning protein
MRFSKAEIDAVIAASPRITVPFNKLVLSQDFQVRPSGSAPKLSLTELAASIKVSGVLQNLVVVKGQRGNFEVCAGGRRLEGLALLVSNGDIPDNYPVPVLVVPADKALIASLAENCFHEPLHISAEIEGMARLIAEGKSVEDVAAAFGVTPLVVKRRLKLAAVSPRLMAQFRQDQIGLDCLMVLASIDDHAKQEQAWANLPSWNRRPDYLRQLLSQGEIESDRDPVAKFVTVKAYEKAGGALRRDLFSDDDKKVYLLDAPLLEKLATEKLQKKARQVTGEGWKWVDVRARYVYDEFVKHGELRKTRRQPSEQEAGELDTLSAKLAALHEQMDALTEEDDDDKGKDETFCRLEAEADALDSQVRAIEETLSVWPAELMAQAGCVVYVGNSGAATVKHGLVRPEDRSDMAQAAREADEGGSGDALVSLPSAKTRPVHSDKLMHMLTAHRVAAVQAELLDRPDVALAALTAHLATKLIRDGFPGYQGGTDALTVNASDTHDGLRREADDMVEGAAWTKMEAQRRIWVERLPRGADAVFPWLMQQDQATLVLLLTFLVATTVTGVSGVERDKQSTDALALALKLDMTKWWKPTGATYLNHVSKGRILDVVAEAAGANAASPLASLKKDAVVAGAEQSMAGTGWLPSCLRTRAMTPDAAGEPHATHEEEDEGAEPALTE